jgi:hypothetical protein
MAQHVVVERLRRRHDEQAAESRQFRQARALAQQVLDLGGEVEGDGGELVVQGTRDGERVAGAVEEVGITEAHVRGARRHLLAHVGEHDVSGHDHEAAAVDGRNRAVTAQVLAPAAALDVGDELPAPVVIELRVRLERGQGRAARRHEGQPPRVRRGRVGGPGQALRERHQARLGLGADDGVDTVREQVVGVEGRVQAVQTDVRGGIHAADALGHAHAQAQRRVHRHRDGHEARTRDLFDVERLHRKVHARREIARLLEECGRGGHRQGLVAHLVARDEEHGARLFHSVQSTPVLLW